MIWLVLLLQLVTTQTIGPPRGTPLSGAALDRETERVSSLLRCPVCQGLSVADSPSAMAINMKAQVRELLSTGYTEEQVLTYFESSYGEFVRLRPQAKGINWLVWIGPIAALLVGGAVIASLLRKAPKTPAQVPPPDDPYLARARELTSSDAGT